jgi:hypothetical protein
MVVKSGKTTTSSIFEKTTSDGSDDNFDKLRMIEQNDAYWVTSYLMRSLYICDHHFGLPASTCGTFAGHSLSPYIYAITRTPHRRCDQHRACVSEPHQTSTSTSETLAKLPKYFNGRDPKRTGHYLITPARWSGAPRRSSDASRHSRN